MFRWWIIGIYYYCLKEAFCAVDRSRFARNVKKEEVVTQPISKNELPHNPDHARHLTIIWILAAVLICVVICAIVGAVIGIICFCQQKKKQKPASKVSGEQSPFQSNPGPHPRGSGSNPNEKKTVALIFGSDPKIEPHAPQTNGKKKKAKMINTQKQRQLYMQQNVDQESSLIEENIIPPSLPAPSSTAPLKTTVPTSTAPPTTTTTAAGSTGAAGKTIEGDTNEKPPGDGTETSYEEAENKPIEHVANAVPVNPAGYRARGPLAPDHIPAEKFKHRGNLVLKKRHKVVLKHELDNEPPIEQKPTDRVQFDSKMNEVIDYGPGVEHIISNKSVLTTTTSQVSKKSTPKNQQQQPPSSGVEKEASNAKNQKEKTTTTTTTTSKNNNNDELIKTEKTQKEL